MSAHERARHRAAPPPPPSPLSATGSPRSLALLLVICAGVLPVLFIWWQNTIAGSLDSPSACLIAAGSIAGLLAAYLLLVLVALMARVPWLENRVGSDVIARYHRSLGEYTVILVCAHALLLTVGYAWQGGTNPVSESVTLLFDYTDVWLSTIALALLLLVGVVSARAVRRKLSYESWYHVHLLVYAAIGLAFAHEFAVGTEFSASLRNRLLWSAAHLVVGAAVLLFRVLLPLWRSLRYRVRVARVVSEGPGVVSLHLTGRNLDRLDAEAGQFLRWRFLARGHWWQSHPYSLSAAPSADGLRITVKDLGDASSSLARLAPGTRVWFEGPYGAFTARRRSPARRVLLIAGGAGITPLRALYESLPGRGSDLVLIYRASRAEDLVLYRELEAIARRRGLGLFARVGPRGHPDQDPLRGSELRAMVPDVADRDVYLCGPAGMTRTVSAHLRAAGVPKQRLHIEAFEL
ncbi:ferredoxin reductase family protein [Streptacidiphilus sp. PB12-B1b]|nr:ferredoxin reductase family protein [Streptacidiphilus sp. PB12-B1b]